MNKQTSLAYDNLELLSELPQDKDLIRLVIDKNKISSVQPSFFDSMFDINDLRDPVNFSFMRMLHYIDECDDDEREILLDLLNDALDVLFYLVNHVKEGDKEATLSEVLHDMDYLVAKYQKKYRKIPFCSKVANYFDEKLNHLLDQVTESLSHCQRYLYMTPTGYELSLEEADSEVVDAGSEVEAEAEAKEDSEASNKND